MTISRREMVDGSVTPWYHRITRCVRRALLLGDGLLDLMQCLNEPISRRANREDKCRGAFWEARFKSVAVLDEGALAATSTYIDLKHSRSDWK